MSTESVLNHHLESFGAGNLEELMGDYTEDSVLIAADATFRGLNEIRNLWTQLLDGLFKPGTFDFTMGRVEIVENIAYIVWSTEGGANIPLGTDTFLITDDKIAIQTFAAHIL